MIRAGEKLREERLKKHLTLEEASKATKIKVSFLLAIEKGEYKKLPPATYAQGFVRNYAAFLGMPEQEILAVFRREYSGEKIVKVLPEGLLGKEEFPLKRFRLQQTSKLIIFVFIMLVSYILFQYRYAIIDPPLTIDSPTEGAVVSSQTITVVGNTDSNASVFVNNDPASLDTNGNFKKVVSVFTGKTTITVKVINYFGRETIVERHIEVK